MTETSLNAEAKRSLKGRGVLVFKTNDNFTMGIPDTYALYDGHHTWLEFKLSPDGTTLPELARRKQVQLVMMRDIRKQNGVALYACYVKTGNHIILEIWDPLEIDPQGRLPDPLNPAMVVLGKGHGLLESICKGETVWHRTT